MKEVIRIEGEKSTEEKPVEFTHEMNECSGWQLSPFGTEHFLKIVYLGECSVDGDMFAAYSAECISIFKGHLNSGKY